MKSPKPNDAKSFDRSEQDFLVLESTTLQNIRIIHVITMNERQYIKVGRGQYLHHTVGANGIILPAE